MNYKIAQSWAAALRSGDYLPKAPEILTLREGNTYSVLGVLCDLYRREVGGEWVGTYFVPEGSGTGEQFGLPEAVTKWANLLSKWAALPGTGVIGVMEDRGYTHHELADLIENNWEYL